MDRTPEKLAKLLSEDVRTNNGFLYDALKNSITENIHNSNDLTPGSTEWPVIEAEIEKVNARIDSLRVYNLKYDEFPQVYVPNLPYGVDVAVKLQQAAMNVRSANYWNVHHSQRDNAANEYDEAKRSWRSLVADLRQYRS